VSVHTPLRPLSFSVGASAPIVDVLKEVQRELPALSECGARCGLYPVLRLMMYLEAQAEPLRTCIRTQVVVERLFLTRHFTVNYPSHKKCGPSQKATDLKIRSLHALISLT